MRFTSQPDDSLEDWIYRHTGRTRRVEVTTHAYGLIPHFILNTMRIATVHRKLAEMSARNLAIRILEPPFEMPSFAEKVQWHSFRDQDPGIAWMRERLRETAAEISSTSAKDRSEPLATLA